MSRPVSVPPPCASPRGPEARVGLAWCAQDRPWARQHRVAWAGCGGAALLRTRVRVRAAAPCGGDGGAARRPEPGVPGPRGCDAGVRLLSVGGSGFPSSAPRHVTWEAEPAPHSGLAVSRLRRRLEKPPGLPVPPILAWTPLKGCGGHHTRGEPRPGAAGRNLVKLPSS